MKKTLLVLAVVLVAAVLGAAGWAAAVWFGWLPVPTPVLQAAAAARGLPADQVPVLEKAARVYQTLRSSPAGSLVDRAVSLPPPAAAPDAWRALAAEAWPKLDAPTLEVVRRELGAGEEEWSQVTAIAARQADRASRGLPFDLEAGEAAELDRFAESTGLAGLLAAASGK